jgi:signal transduction histidine kinase
VIAQVRQYYRGGHQELADIDVNVELRRAIEAWSDQWHEVRIVWQLDVSAPLVRMPLASFQEIIDNILGNSARHMELATPPAAGHHLTVTTRIERDRVVLEIRNSGSSDLPPNPTAIWTTTDAGHGTGLGLAIVVDHVGQAGGRFEILSNPDGPGVTNRIVLPNALWQPDREVD